MRQTLAAQASQWLMLGLACLVMGIAHGTAARSDGMNGRDRAYESAEHKAAIDQANLDLQTESLLYEMAHQH